MPTAATPSALLALAHDPVRIRGVARVTRNGVDETASVLETARVFRSAPMPHNLTTAGSPDLPRETPMGSLAVALQAHREVSLGALVDALEAVGLEVQAVLDERGHVNPHRLDVVGDDPADRWSLGRETLGSGWYGRPSSGRAPWGFGPAPRGASLAAYLFALVAEGGVQ
jgi:hypothetical protein